MAKRARGTVRPGQRRPIERRPASSATPAKPAATPVVAPRPSGLTEAETARAAEIEATLLAEERAAEQARRRTRDRPAVREIATSGGSLAKRADEEYAYVARDVRDIIRVAVIMITTLLVLYFAIDVAKVIPIG